MRFPWKLTQLENVNRLWASTSAGFVCHCALTRFSSVHLKKTSIKVPFPENRSDLREQVHGSRIAARADGSLKKPARSKGTRVSTVCVSGRIVAASPPAYAGGTDKIGSRGGLTLGYYLASPTGTKPSWLRRSRTFVARRHQYPTSEATWPPTNPSVAPNGAPGSILRPLSQGGGRDGLTPGYYLASPTGT